MFLGYNSTIVLPSSTILRCSSGTFDKLINLPSFKTLVANFIPCKL